MTMFYHFKEFGGFCLNAASVLCDFESAQEKIKKKKIAPETKYRITRICRDCKVFFFITERNIFLKKAKKILENLEIYFSH